MIDLILQNGILLKPYDRAFLPSGEWGRAPRGWTPRVTPWVKVRVDQLILEGMPQTLAEDQVFIEYGAYLKEHRLPFPGLVPIKPATDPKISRAYLELFVHLNPEKSITDVSRSPAARARVTWPPDGHYQLRNGKMILIKGGEH